MNIVIPIALDNPLLASSDTTDVVALSSSPVTALLHASLTDVLKLRPEAPFNCLQAEVVGIGDSWFVERMRYAAHTAARRFWLLGEVLGSLPEDDKRKRGNQADVNQLHPDVDPQFAQR